MFSIQTIKKLLQKLKQSSDLATLINSSLSINNGYFFLRLINFMKNKTLDFSANAFQTWSVISHTNLYTVNNSLLNEYEYILQVLSNLIYLKFTNAETIIFASVIFTFGNDNIQVLNNLWPGFMNCATRYLKTKQEEEDNLMNYPLGLPEEWHYAWDYLSTRSWGIKAKKNIQIICGESGKKNKRITDDDWNEMFYRDNKCYIRICEKYNLNSSEIIL
jgi:hypothetical protein